MVEEIQSENEVRAKSGDPDLNVLKTVSYYNYGLGRLFLLLDLLISLRDADVILRRERFKQMRAERLDAIEKNRVRDRMMQQEMAEAQQEEGDNFNQAEWIATYNENNPEMQVPDEPQRDIDLDCDPVEEKTEPVDDQGDGQADGIHQDQPTNPVLVDDDAAKDAQ